MTDKEIIDEIEANERRAAEHGSDRREGEPGNLITEAVDTIFHPMDDDRVDDEEEAARRIENDREQRPD
jgi:hypothetical protein